MKKKLPADILSNKSFRESFSPSFLNGLFYSQSSYKIHPILHTSDFISQPSPLSNYFSLTKKSTNFVLTSGLIYYGVPTLENTSKVPLPNMRPSPKSAIFKFPSADMRILAGFRSLCMILCKCIWLIPEIICSINSQIFNSENLSSLSIASLISFFQSPFSAHSQIMYNSLLRITLSRKLMIFGCSNF